LRVAREVLEVRDGGFGRPGGAGVRCQDQGGDGDDGGTETSEVARGNTSEHGDLATTAAY
jgi:hypothetical protein